MFYNSNSLNASKAWSGQTCLLLPVPVVADDPGGDLGTRGEVEFGENALHVVLRGALGDVYGRRDLPVGELFRDEGRDLTFPAGEGARRVLGQGQP